MSTKLKTKIIDITGKTFNNLTVLEFAGQSKNKEALWLCKCVCGKTKAIKSSRLRSGELKSCGCIKPRAIKHGHCPAGNESRTYQIWHSMLARCNNPNMKYYDRYGGRAITVCDRWCDFSNFLEDMGEVPEGMSIDRIDNDKGYCKENCRWTTMKEQGRNRSSNVNVTYNGKTQCLSAWAEELGVPRSTISTRLKRGWDEVKAITTPVKHKHKRGLN